jgi:hypothetical protein
MITTFFRKWNKDEQLYWHKINAYATAYPNFQYQLPTVIPFDRPFKNSLLKANCVIIVGQNGLNCVVIVRYNRVGLIRTKEEAI